jgi:methyltransferase family protein
LEQDRSLHEPRHLPQRFAALDQLDSFLSDGQLIVPPLHHRATAIYAELEAVNVELYGSIRRDIQRGAGAATLLEWMPDTNALANPTIRGGYDYLDELLTGIFQFHQPSPQLVQLNSEMVAYQPTPARHIFDFIRRTALAEHDTLIDLGSGLGHVILLASICSRASCVGIELEPSYIECARNCARSLDLSNAHFIQADARASDFSRGTVFYLYTPFSGAILREALNALRHQALTRQIRICTFGPCTSLVAEEPWLRPTGPVETNRLAIFRSRD